MLINSFFTFVFYAMGLAQAQPAWPELSKPVKTALSSSKRDAALIIAIEDYSHVADIPGAVSNGRDWYYWLTKSQKIPPSRVQLLENNQATDFAIKKKAKLVAKMVKPGGRLWLVFIGHGAPAKNGKSGILLGEDVQQTADSIYNRGISQDELLSELEKGAGQVVAVIDSCFSGRSASGTMLVQGLQPLIASRQLKRRKSIVLSAGTSAEFAGPLPGASRPAFSYLALGALRGWGDSNNDGKVAANEVVQYAKDALLATLQGRSQSPQLYASGAAGRLPLSRSTEDGPDLATMRGALAVGVTTSGGSKLSSGNIAKLKQLQQQRLAAEQAEQALIQKVKAERQQKLSSTISMKQQEAKRLWAEIRPLLKDMGPESKKAVQAFIQDWSEVEITIEDMEGKHSQIVEVPEVAEARAWLKKAARYKKKKPKKTRSTNPKVMGWSSAGAIGLLSGAALVRGIMLESQVESGLQNGSLSRQQAEDLQSSSNLMYGLGYGGLAVTLGVGIKTAGSTSGLSFQYQGRW